MQLAQIFPAILHIGNGSLLAKRLDTTFDVIVFGFVTYLFFFYSGERIRKVPDSLPYSPYPCERKPYPEKKVAHSKKSVSVWTGPNGPFKQGYAYLVVYYFVIFWPVFILFVKCWKVAHWNVIKVLKLVWNPEAYLINFKHFWQVLLSSRRYN